MTDLSHSIGKSYGCQLEAGHHCRATYIIDPNGKICHITLNDPRVGRNIDDIYRLVEAYQYSSAHGEVCPVNWKRGDAAIIPDIERKHEYFSTLKK